MRNFGRYYHNDYLNLVTESKDSFFTKEFNGAFFGAFFAFVFGVVAYFVQKKFDRYFKHKNAVVEMEYVLQRHLDMLSTNEYLLRGAIKTISADKFTFTLLNSFPLPDNLALKLADLALINKYEMEYVGTVTRMNHSMQTWQSMNDKLHDAAISGVLKEQDKNVNQGYLVTQAIELIKFLKGMDEEAQYLVAYVRVFIKKDKYIWSLPIYKYRNKLERDEDIVTDLEVKSELKLMKKEIIDSQAKSREKIKKVSEMKVTV